MLAPISRVLGGLGPRGAFIASAILLTCTGAAVGAGSAPKPDLRFGAEATIAVRRDTVVVAPHQLQVAPYASAVTAPQVIAAARGVAGSRRSVAEIAHDLAVVAKPGRQVVLVRARDTSPAAATALVNALATGAVEHVLDSSFLSSGGAHVLGEFEDGGLGRWGASTSAFALPPRDLRSVAGPARFGSGKLRVTCPATRPCGASVRVYGSFRRRSTYRAEGWVRSAAGRTGVRVVLGSSVSNHAVGDARRVSPSWRRVETSWTPTRHAVWADVIFRTTAADESPFEIDGVRLLRQSPRDAAAPPASLVQTTSFIRNHNVALGRSALGALGGLLIALAAIGLAELARRRLAAAGPPSSDAGGGALREEAKR
ncbi:MAG TPA: hypothetical protein VNW68_02080 [Candidatus Limnocylindria bacterium]|nr:hypothetical protein [Candidatus Limnocylindria bacterium]